MRKSSGEPKSIEAEIESSNSEERDQTDDSDVPQADTPAQDAATDAEPAQSEDWWSMSQQTADWAEPAPVDPTEDVSTTNEPRTADVYCCDHFGSRNQSTFWRVMARSSLLLPGIRSFIAPRRQRFLAISMSLCWPGRAINRERLEHRSFLPLPARNRWAARQQWNKCSNLAKSFSRNFGWCPRYGSCLKRRPIC